MSNRKLHPGIERAFEIVITGLALVSGYFIVSEVLLFVRELTGGEPRSVGRRKRDAEDEPSFPGLTLEGATGPLTDASWRERIQPMRDAEVVQQLIDHFVDDEPSLDEE